MAWLTIIMSTIFSLFMTYLIIRVISACDEIEEIHNKIIEKEGI